MRASRDVIGERRRAHVRRAYGGGVVRECAGGVAGQVCNEPVAYLAEGSVVVCHEVGVYHYQDEVIQGLAGLGTTSVDVVREISENAHCGIEEDFWFFFRVGVG